jgi:hypothetical protein
LPLRALTLPLSSPSALSQSCSEFHTTVPIPGLFTKSQDKSQQTSGEGPERKSLKTVTQLCPYTVKAAAHNM